MKLTKKQKQLIKKKYRRLDIGQIAKELGIESVQVEAYLKKKISQEKYQKITRGSHPGSWNNFSGFSNFFTKNRGFILALVGLVSAIYLNGIDNGFVSDDIGAIVKNENVGKFSAIFGSIFGSLQAFIRYLTFHIFQLSPAAYRIANILLHMGSTVLVFTIVSLLHKRTVAFFAALLFAVHPLLVESVTWISGMPYTLYGFLFLLSFYFYILAENSKKYYYFAIIFFFLSCITSEKAIPLFLVFMLYEWVFKNNKSFWKISAPFFAVALILGIIFAGGFGQRVSELETNSYQENKPDMSPIVQVPVAISQYFKLLVWPAKLSLYQTEMSFSGGTYFLMVLLSATVLGALIISFFKNKLVFFWLAFFFIALSVTLTPLGVAWIVAERYVYLASLGFFVIAAFGLDWIYEKSKRQGEIFEKTFYALLTVVVIALGTRTIVRNFDWKNEDSLWIATAKVAPSGQQIHNNLGDVYGRRGNHEKAIEEFKKAIEINPNYADAYHNLANTYQEAGQTGLAIENYQKAIENNPQLWQSYQSLAAIYFNQGQYVKALENIKKALEINPSNENLRQNLQIIEQKMK